MYPVGFMLTVIQAAVLQAAVRENKENKSSLRIHAPQLSCLKSNSIFIQGMCWNQVPITRNTKTSLINTIKEECSKMDQGMVKAAIARFRGQVEAVMKAEGG
uniref:Uncharacterized protein n=1 Tax=Lepeophtheirus salmonis TaxID=72036 RepID=A0A0K2V2G8_LEPSM